MFICCQGDGFFLILRVVPQSAGCELTKALFISNLGKIPPAHWSATPCRDRYLDGGRKSAKLRNEPISAVQAVPTTKRSQLGRPGGPNYTKRSQLGRPGRPNYETNPTQPARQAQLRNEPKPTGQDAPATKRYPDGGRKSAKLRNKAKSAGQAHPGLRLGYVSKILFMNGKYCMWSASANRCRGRGV